MPSDLFKMPKLDALGGGEINQGAPGGGGEIGDCPAGSFIDAKQVRSPETSPTLAKDA
ncbi:MAG: hypothetical protein R3F11_27770 [Verrucomicrobiales bacterium]